MPEKKKEIKTDYPPEVIDHFVSWLTEHGYNYEEVFRSALETQDYYMQRFLKENPDINQLSIPFS